jgi:two-component system LytT family sensor kinase
VSKGILTYSKIVSVYAGWWILWMCVQTYILSAAGFDLVTACIDSAITQAVFAFAGYAINTSMHSYQPSLRNSFYVFAWSIALEVLCVAAQRGILVQFFGDDANYMNFLDHTLVLRGSFGWLMIILVAVLTWFWVYASELHETQMRKEDTSRLAREAELTNLRQQLQPHFLFNSLNSISALAGSHPTEARKMIQQLSDFLRGTIKKDDKSLVTLEEELHHLQLYLDIEKVRFGHRLAVQIDKTDESLAMNLPSLLLQPIVENAIKFGLYDTVGDIGISVSSRTQDNLLLIEVKNPFDPATSVPQRGTGFGLTSVQRRLSLMYFRNDLLSTSQSENIFTTTLKIPQTA